MRSELPNTYVYQDDGSVLVRARNSEDGITENGFYRKDLSLDIRFVNSSGELNQGQVALKPVVSRIQKLDDKLSPMRINYLAALNCYTSLSTDDLTNLAETKPEEEIRNFLKQQILATGHGSVMEHAGPCFIVDGISRVESHQEVRHRHRSYSQQSQRYLDFARSRIIEQGKAEFPFVIPPRIRAEQGNLDAYLHSIKTGLETYYALRADGVWPEDARFLFPNAAATRMVVSGNVRAWREVFAQRTCARAQWEIDITTTEIARQIWEDERVFIEETGPACSLGTCDQGKRSCRVPLNGSLAEVFDSLQPGDPYPHDQLIFGMR